MIFEANTTVSFLPKTNEDAGVVGATQTQHGGNFFNDNNIRQNTVNPLAYAFVGSKSYLPHQLEIARKLPRQVWRACRGRRLTWRAGPARRISPLADVTGVGS